MTVLGCGWEPEEEVEEEDWPGGLGSEVAGDGESTPVCFWLRGTEADWEIHESGRREISYINSKTEKKTFSLILELPSVWTDLPSISSFLLG